MTAALFLGQYINLTLELGVWMNGTWLSQYLTALDFLTVDTTEQSTDVITSNSVIHHLAEHLDTGNNGVLRLILKTNDLNSIIQL